MSEVRLNILDAGRAITGTVHGSEADFVLAALSAEPETIEELQDAMTRFSKPAGDRSPFALFYAGIDEEPWDAGIVFVDLAARVFAAESSYSLLMPQGEVQYHNGEELTEVWLPYLVPDDWLFLDSIEEFRNVADGRRAKRAAVQPLDARAVLYGRALTEFVAGECGAARDSAEGDPVADIHARWLMTPRSDLRGLAPREVMLLKKEYIDRELQCREMQWTRLREPAPCLKKESHAYRFAGFGTHEIVTYYELVRYLIEDSWNQLNAPKDISTEDEISRLDQVKTDWLESPHPDYRDKTPGNIIEDERTRLPWVSFGEDAIIDEDCPLCRAMAEDPSPGFWHMDGCNMDDEFAFSFYLTREEWEEEKRHFEEMFAEFERKDVPKEESRPN